MIHYNNVPEPFIQSCFTEAVNGFPELQNRSITLRRTWLKTHTMRAQPLVNFRFFHPSKRQYRIDMSSHTLIREQLRLAELPRSVLVGWFAHELGHIMDYLPRSAWDLMWFGLRYLWDDPFRAGAERRADLYAIKHGFSDDIQATKQYILAHAHLPANYIAAIRKYYMSPAEVEHAVRIAEEKGPEALFEMLPPSVEPSEEL